MQEILAYFGNINFPFFFAYIWQHILFFGQILPFAMFPDTKFEVSISGRNRLSYSCIKIRNVSALPKGSGAAQKKGAPTCRKNSTSCRRSTAVCARTFYGCRKPSFRQAALSLTAGCIKSFVFTTDIAIIRNCDADAVFAVYPFTPQQAISDAIIKASYIPVFCGVGGGTTKGMRTVSLAKDVESQGAMGVVLNAPISDLNLLAVSKAVDIPVIATVTREDTDIAMRLESGASILNIACGYRTPEVVRKIREQFRQVPLIASGGKTNETVRETILAGANAITYTPPSAQDLFKTIMAAYRE